MEIEFSQSARKHRIGRERVLFVISRNEPVDIVSDGARSDRILWMGVDERGLELEVIGVRTSVGVLIIHVMPRIFRRGKGKL